MPTIEEVVNGYFNNLPHPQAPSIKVGDFPIATRLATMLKFGGGHASAQEAANFWTEFQSMNQGLIAQNKMPIGPEEFTHLTQQMARSSFAFHGRPPSMYEVARLRDAHPKDVADFYAALPDEHYPTVSAGDMARSLMSARPWANQIVGREPNKLEAAHLHASGQSPRDYYQAVHGDDQSGGNAGAVGTPNAGGQSPSVGADGAGMASGNAASGGTQGVPSR